METKLLMIHGNGGARSRFLPFLQELYQQPVAFTPVIPELPGFEGRVLPPANDYWDLFIRALQAAVEQHGASAPWVLYGHGIGGSMLLEWGRRGYGLPGDPGWQPQKVILHSCIGASLKKRLFPKLMKPMFIRRLLHRLIPWKPMQRIWERKLFQYPERIPQAVRDRFFADYQQCAAFPVFFDLIDPAWYTQAQQALKTYPFYFLWGDRERVVASRYLTLWQSDFPNSHFEVVPDWDHFPMLDDPGAFQQKIAQIVTAQGPMTIKHE